MAIDTRCIPTYMFNVVVKVLRAGGLDPEPMMESSGLTLVELSRQDTRLSFAQSQCLIGNALALTSDPGLGLSVANQMNFTDWGMFGYAVASCATLEEALGIGLRYSGAATRLTENSLQVSDNYFALTSDTLYPVGDLLPFFIEEDLGGVIHLLQTYIGDPVRPREVHFSYQAPRYKDRYRAHFRCPVKFDRPVNQIVWDINAIHQPLPGHNPVASQQAINLCEELIRDQNSEHGVVDKVRSRLLQTPGEFASINTVAEEMGMSESTLRRALKAEGSSFQSVLDSVREKMAKQYLATSDLLLEDIAYLVGFSDVSNFRRAFKKWTGKPPLAFRKR
ncbi:AraC family transcriptional regulator [Pseudomaricurvus alkylphenolicus]|jgi:AraC-like DNA-binding protein|uniref:AraC family transcriptional regulator n=1 Tax=Pseudomaricurvus alkylphenolicus TaxID=1306991 RepID=UPI00142481FC|nr:AraC family transcriptional regulator [Pseudomaricurvus alkylphenolicus]NIB42979.1 AraC family transcriptional regulator [Pseudomaricurvus alkylphenolicus]